MQKTPIQEKLEAQRQQDIKDIVMAALEQYRGLRKNLVAMAALDLDISDATLYLWCHDLGIDIDSYRHGAPDTDNHTNDNGTNEQAEHDPA